MADYSEVSIEELEEKIKAAKKVQMTVTIIFGLIIVAWLVLGYWRTNVPVFISTLAVAIITTITTGRGPAAMQAEVDKRKAGD